MTAAISTATLDSLTGKTAAATTSASQTYNQFLTLLTTQLKNQDPLDPMQSNEFTNQLVQFSQVEQAILGNQKLDTLLTQTNANQLGQSLAYIGKDVFYQGNSIHFSGEGDIKMGYAIDGDAKSAKLRVIDEGGNIIRTMDVPTGTTSGNITWDGKDDFEQAAKEGNYTIRIDALSKTDTPLDTFTGVPAHVDGLETVAGVLYLSLDGDRRVAATSILSVSGTPEVTDGTLDTTGNTGDTGSEGGDA